MQLLAMLIKYFYEWGFVVKFEKAYKKFFEKGRGEVRFFEEKVCVAVS